MLDLETLSSESNAAIAAIGAVEFNTEGLGREFYMELDVDGQQENFGRHVSASTFAWWTQQSAEARALFAPGRQRRSVIHALVLFGSYLDEVVKSEGLQVLELWGNGADFDNVILGNAYAAVKVKRPWSYSKNRCFRTLKNLVDLGPGEGYPRLGTHHNALDDAKHQALYAGAYLRKMYGPPDQ
jgi:hypothetical protein